MGCIPAQRDDELRMKIVSDFAPMETSLRYLLKISAIMMWLLIPVMIIMGLLILGPAMAVDKIVSTINIIFRVSA